MYKIYMSGRGRSYMYSVKQKEGEKEREREEVRYKEMKENENNPEYYRSPELILGRSIGEGFRSTIHYCTLC